MVSTVNSWPCKTERSHCSVIRVKCKSEIEMTQINKTCREHFNINIKLFNDRSHC